MVIGAKERLRQGVFAVIVFLPFASVLDVFLFLSSPVPSPPFLLSSLPVSPFHFPSLFALLPRP